MISEAWRVAESSVYGATTSATHKTLSIPRGAICGANRGIMETLETPGTPAATV
jgi:hypothetical protein